MAFFAARLSATVPGSLLGVDEVGGRETMARMLVSVAG